VVFRLWMPCLGHDGVCGDDVAGQRDQGPPRCKPGTCGAKWKYVWPSWSSILTVSHNRQKERRPGKVCTLRGENSGFRSNAASAVDVEHRLIKWCVDRSHDTYRFDHLYFHPNTRSRSDIDRRSFWLRLKSRNHRPV
jgi:hypothetical protein